MYNTPTAEQIKAGELINKIINGEKIDKKISELLPYLVEVSYEGDYKHYMRMAARQILERYYPEEAAKERAIHFIDHKKLDHTTNALGYRITYCGQEIGGDGCLVCPQNRRNQEENIRYYTTHAQNDIEMIRFGRGDPEYLSAIYEINRQRLNEKVQ